MVNTLFLKMDLMQKVVNEMRVLVVIVIKPIIKNMIAEGQNLGIFFSFQ